ncbi:MAG: hypothetical protein AB1896_12295, partial [Thermodesulfobacteriota bacterium]
KFQAGCRCPVGAGCCHLKARSSDPPPTTAVVQSPRPSPQVAVAPGADLGRERLLAGNSLSQTDAPTTRRHLFQLKSSLLL